MKKMKKILALVCGAVFALFCAFPNIVNFANATTVETGMRFSATDAYEIDKYLSKTPLTYEAEFKLTDTEAKTGTSYLFGNYVSDGATGGLVNLRIRTDGRPLIYMFQATGANNYYIFFSDVNVATGNKVHLAVTCDRDNFYCYVDGVLMQTVNRVSGTNGTSPVDDTKQITTKMRVGSDLTSTTDNFKGELYTLSMYKDCRTAAEIAGDAKGLNIYDDDIMLAYDFTGVTSDQTIIEDLSPNNYDIYNTNKLWKWSTTPKYNPDDYAFSFMLVGDTQIVSRYSILGLERDKIFTQGNTYMDMIYDYIVDNVETKKVKHVFGLGDVTEYNSKNEWEEAVRVTSKLNGVVPYSIVRGNHDLSTNWFANTVLKREGLVNEEPYFTYDYVGGGVGSPNNGTVDTARGDQYFEEYFGSANTGYASQYTYCYNNDPRNTIHFFTGSDNLEYMVVVMDYGPTDDMLEWASNIIEQYPNHNVIVTTHGYMWAEDKNNKYIEAADGSGMTGRYGLNGANANCGDEMWAELISQHENIKMVFCGHVDYDSIVYRQDKGVNGNIVTQMLCDPQGIDIKNVGQPLIASNGDTAYNRLVGMVATYYVSADGKTIDVEWYSPIQKAYYLEQAQFTFTAEANEFPRVTAKVKNGNGSVTPTKVDTNGAPVTVTFAPNVGYAIKKVTVNGINVTDQVANNKLVISDTTGYNGVEVEYYALDKYAFSVTNDTNKGTVNFTTSTQSTYLAGETVSFSVSAKTGYAVNSVKFNGHTVTANAGTYTVTIAPTSNILEITYDYTVPGTYSLTVINDTNKGTITSQTAIGSTYESGAQISFSVSAKNNYAVNAVKFNGHTVTAVGGVYTVTIEPTDNIIEIIYNSTNVPAPATYSLTVSNNSALGSILGQIASTYQAGEQVSFSISKIGSKAIKAVKFNGHTVTAVDNVYTVTIAPTDNIIEVIYDDGTTASAGCSMASITSILGVITLCGVMLFKKF